MSAGLPTLCPHVPYKVLHCGQPRSQAEGENKGLAPFSQVFPFKFPDHGGGEGEK